MDTVAIILSSTLVSGLVSALIGGWFNLRSKQSEYANAYYKLILERRMKAYKEVEILIGSIEMAVVDSDQRPYHMLFSNDDDHAHVYRVLAGRMSNALWLSDDLFQITRELNLLVYGKATEQQGLVEFGKKNYQVIAELRTRMEQRHLKDMLTLHDAPAFLKSKKPSDSYAELPTHG